MNREVHVRFWESAGVRFHCATHLPPRLRLRRPRQGGDRALHRLLQHGAPAFFARQEDAGRVLLRNAARDQTGSMSGEHELPTASVVRSSQAMPARRRGHLCTDVRPAGLHLSKPVPCSNNRCHLCGTPSQASVESSAVSRQCPLLAGSGCTRPSADSRATANGRSRARRTEPGVPAVDPLPPVEAREQTA
jgi:hypothetical protein